MFNFTGLRAAFAESLKSGGHVLAFELRDGMGRFVFMMFFSDDDDPGDRSLFIYLARTNTLIDLKLYGNHQKGDFKVYLKEQHELAIREELGIRSGNIPFQLDTLLSRLNSNMPETLSLSASVGAIHEHRDSIVNFSKIRDRIDDDANKIYLIGPMKLTGRKPRDKTVRKLYFYVDAAPEAIERLIIALKAANCTLMWSSTPPDRRIDIQSIIQNIR